MAFMSVFAWVYLALTVYQIVNRPKMPDQNVQGPRFTDLTVISSAYGQMIPIIAGEKFVAPNIIWAAPVREVDHVDSQEVGGKSGGGSTVTQTTYSYFADFAVLCCEGVAAGVRRIKFNGELKYDVGDGASSESVMASAVNARAIRFYPGTELQEVDPLIESYEGADAPSYRGCSIMVFEWLDVTAYGGKIPNIEIELIKDGAVSDLAVPLLASTGVTTTSAKVLGRGGNIWAGPDGSSRALRFSFYTGTVVGSYVPPSFAWYPTGLTAAREGVGPNVFGSSLGVFHDDGSQTVYTGSVGSCGSNAIIAESDDVLWVQGDSSAGWNCWRVVLNHTAKTYTATFLTGFLGNGWLVNGARIAGRLYGQESAVFSNPPYIGYFETTSLAWVRLWNPGSVIFRPVIASDESIWLQGSATTIEKRSRDGVLLATVTLPESGAWTTHEAPDGLIWACGPRAYVIHPTTLEIIARSVPFNGSMLGHTEEGRAVIWDTSTGSIRLREVEPLGRVSSTGTPLDDFIAELADRVGITAGQLDLTELAGDVLQGYAIARRDTLRSALEPLQVAFGFDLIESSGRLVARKRGGAVVASIPEDDLAARPYGAAPVPKVANTRALETELPREVDVQYFDVDAMHEIGSQYARRLTGRSSAIEGLDLPIVMDAGMAAGIAERVLYDRWSSRNRIELALSRKWSYLEPGDIVTTTADGIAHTLRVDRIYDSAGLFKLGCVTEDVSVYSPAALGVSLPDSGLTVSPAGPTVLRLLDIPLLRDVDDGPGVYAAAAGYYTGWRGAEVWYSTDAGATFSRSQTTFLAASVMGAALTALQNFQGGNVFDELSYVDVQVFGGTLSSDSEANVLDGANAAYLGGELINFKSAALVSTGKYRLSGLLRGRRGTEQYIGTHAVGDAFVLLSEGALRRIVSAASDIGRARVYKAPGFGQALAEATSIDFTDTGVTLKPLAPVHLVAGRNAAGDVVGSFVRRTRISGEWRDLVDVPLGETSEAYEVEVFTSSTYATVKRTITGLSSPAFTYTSAQQVTDFGSNQATVYVRVYQVSAVVGRGFPCQGAI